MLKLFDLAQAVRACVRALAQPYTVLVAWEGRVYAHQAWTSEEAREWCGAYPGNAYCEVFTRFGCAPVFTRGAR
jgi:hypothetical protein